jgi:hypothetical protein
VSASVTSQAIHKALSARWPWPLIRAGGPEVYTATWIPRIVPDLFVDAIASGVFRYGEDLSSSNEGGDGLLTRIKKAIGG